MGKGQNYENQNIKIQKERQKCFKASEHQKCPSEFPKCEILHHLRLGSVRLG
jgi:hypothetical protein